MHTNWINRCTHELKKSHNWWGVITNFKQIAKDTEISKSHALAPKSEHENIYV